MIRKFLPALALLLAASIAHADSAIPDTIYNPNVSFPSYADVQSLKFVEPDFGFKQELHLDQNWNRLFEAEPAAPKPDDGN